MSHRSLRDGSSVRRLFFVLVRGWQAQCLSIEFIRTLGVHDGNSDNYYTTKKKGLSTHRMFLQISVVWGLDSHQCKDVCESRICT